MGRARKPSNIGLSRRQLLQGAAGLTTLGLAGRSSPARSERAQGLGGRVTHLLPTASDDRFLIKASLSEPESKAPRLRIGRRTFAGRRTDSTGEFWLFDAAGIEANTSYELSLRDAADRALCEPWPLRSMPAPDHMPERARLLVYTCAGGHEAIHRDGGRQFLSLATRQKLLERGLSFAPDAIVANGDHVYWDQTTAMRGQGIGAVPGALDISGAFDRTLPVLGSDNEEVLKRAVGPQVAELYGTRLRSAPVFFLQDDHDYFEGDAAIESLISFPPDPFMKDLARASQFLYYPEFLPDPARPSGLPGASRVGRPAGVGECFGTLRFGRLLELLLWDCRRFMTLKGQVATFVPTEAEDWLVRRTGESDCAHLVHTPSVPVGWSAGKWGEWYPDVLDERGRLGTTREKYFWQPGWLAQHDRILSAASAARRRPLFINGDLHSFGEGVIHRSGEHDFRANPITTVLSGALGTERGWPSTARETVGQASTVLEMEESLGCLEKNGFLIVDFTPDEVTVRHFGWRPEDGEETIAGLEPFRTSRFPKRS